MVDAPGLGPDARNGVGVRVPLLAPLFHASLANKKKHWIKHKMKNLLLGLAVLASLTLAGFFLVSSAAPSSTPIKPTKPTAKMTTPDNTEFIVLGMGCFWGAEKRMSELKGVLDVESAYAGGDSSTTSYQGIQRQELLVRSGLSKEKNHAEVVKVIFDPKQVSLEQVLAHFWESHDPTQGDRQGNDIGSNYRSAIYFNTPAQEKIARATLTIYQTALKEKGKGVITTDIRSLKNYVTAEEYHQNYLVKNPDGYCGLGGTGVKYPLAKGLNKELNKGLKEATPMRPASKTPPRPLDPSKLSFDRQLIMFAAEDCSYCRAFEKDIAAHWQSVIPLVETWDIQPPKNWTLDSNLFATPTIVLFEKGKEVARYTGYNGQPDKFWQWLGFHLLTPEQQKIAFHEGTERPFTSSLLDEKRPGVFVDSVSGMPLFRNTTKFNSGTGWPSFFQPIEGSVTYHEDRSILGTRTEVRSKSSGIHLGHVFDDGPPPTGKRYCINGEVLRFVPD